MIEDRLTCLSGNNAMKSGVNDLIYIFENEKYTEENGVKFLEFDVSIQANNTLTYFDAGVIVLTYNPTSFGSGFNVSNNDIIVTRGDILLSESDYYPPTVEDLPDIGNKKYFRIVTSINGSTPFPIRNQREVISIQACDLLAARSDGDTGVEFMITHEASNPDIEIAASSACIFKVVEKQHEPDIISKQEVSIFPNPTNSYLTLHMELMEDSSVSAFIYTVQGVQVRTLMTERVMSSGKHDITQDISDLSNGMYLCEYMINGVRTATKIIKMK